MDLSSNPTAPLPGCGTMSVLRHLWLKPGSLSCAGRGPVSEGWWEAAKAGGALSAVAVTQPTLVLLFGPLD